MTGWGRVRALLLAFLAAVAVVALAVSLVGPPEGSGAGVVDGRGGVYAADPTIGSENATLRALDEATPRRWPDGRAGRHLVAWLFAVLVAATVATTGSRRLGVPGLIALPATWPGGRSLAPRAPPFLVRPL